MTDATHNSTPDPGTALDPIARAIEEIAAGRPIVVVDDEDRENEGDLIMAAEFASPDTIGFFVRYSSGVICAPMLAERAEAFGLPSMVTNNEDPKGTAYTISCDAVDVSTGISAAERALTGRILAADVPDPAAITRPGHVFPLVARPGGVRERPGHTEASVEFARLAGATPVAMIGEVVHDDGSMMRFDALRAFATEHSLVMVSIEQLIKYLDEVDPAGVRAQPHDSVSAEDIEVTPEVPLPTKFGNFLTRAFTINGRDHLGVYRDVRPNNTDSHPAPLVRVHSECLTGDVFGSRRCDCGEQLELALEMISAEGGALLYLGGHEGRGIGLSNKIRAYALQDAGFDTVDANLELGFHDDQRDYTAAAQMLHTLGLERIRLLTNNPNKTLALENMGITVESVVGLETTARPENSKYLLAKRNRMHHHLNLAG